MSEDFEESKNVMIPDAKHILYESSRDIRDIARPLEQYLNIKEFTYEKIYNNNQKVKLTNQPGWMSYFYQNNFHLLGGDATVDNLHSGITLTANMINVNNDKIIFESCKQFFDIGDGILLINRFEEYREIFWFTSDTSNKYLINYPHTIELLKIFANSFKEKASKIIKNAEYQKILRPPTKQPLALSANQNYDPDEIAFLKEMSTKKYRFCYKKREIILSRKELQCALGVLCGKSAKEIAAELCRSVRTIEAHIDNIKFKIGSSSRSGLVGVLLDMGISVYLNRIF